MLSVRSFSCMHSDRQWRIEGEIEQCPNLLSEVHSPRSWVGTSDEKLSRVIAFEWSRIDYLDYNDKETLGFPVTIFLAEQVKNGNWKLILKNSHEAASASITKKVSSEIFCILSNLGFEWRTERPTTGRGQLSREERAALTLVWCKVILTFRITLRRKSRDAKANEKCIGWEKLRNDLNERFRFRGKNDRRKVRLTFTVP